MNPTYRKTFSLLVLGIAASVAGVMLGCSNPPVSTSQQENARAPTGSPPATPAAPPVAGTPPTEAPPPNSLATTPKAYRRDAATHLYALNAERIYKGMMRPNLYAIGVLEVDIDRRGQVTATRWMRAPQHAPEVMAEILRTVRAAAPYPIPQRMGRVTYTDIWLWDKSGTFQLDTLTEGQM